MKFLLVFASLVLAINASTDVELWTKFKLDHGKTYKSLREEKIRLNIFKSNLRTIEEHNAKYKSGEETWYMGINQFSDLTDVEFKDLYLSSEPMNDIKPTGRFVPPLSVVPAAYDWREKGVVLSVKNQLNCGSCWAFSATGSLEGQNALKHNVTVDLSPQELVDCTGNTTKYKNNGCHGGWMDNGFKYIKDHGISTLADYEYTGTDGECKPPQNSAGIKLTGYNDVEDNEDSLKVAVATVGPIASAINANYIKQYSGGIFSNMFCGSQLNHGVLVVGYGTVEFHHFWAVKNSWGSSWGENGYIRMTRNRLNQCGIASRPSYPIIE